MKLKFYFHGLSDWIRLKREWRMFRFWILPSVEISYDEIDDADEYPTNVTFAWLFWYVSVFAERKSNDKLRKSTEINH